MLERIREAHDQSLVTTMGYDVRNVFTDVED